jgi:hypothetical protein
MDRKAGDRLSDNHAITMRIPCRATAGAAGRVVGQHLRSFPAETAQQAIRLQRHPERVLSLRQVLTLHQHAEPRQHRLDHRQRPRTDGHLGLPAWLPRFPFHDHVRLLRHRHRRYAQAPRTGQVLGVARTTVRRAIARLRDQAAIRTMPGGGSYIAKRES